MDMSSLNFGGLVTIDAVMGINSWMNCIRLVERFDVELLWWKYEIFMVAYARVDSWSISRNVVDLWSHNGGLHEWNLMDK